MIEGPYYPHFVQTGKLRNRGETEDNNSWTALTRESGVVSRGNKGLLSLLESRRVFLGAH